MTETKTTTYYDAEGTPVKDPGDAVRAEVVTVDESGRVLKVERYNRAKKKEGNA